MTEVAEESTYRQRRMTPRNTRARRHLPGDPSMWFFVIGDLIIFGVYFVATCTTAARTPTCSCRARPG